MQFFKAPIFILFVFCTRFTCGKCCGVVSFVLELCFGFGKFLFCFVLQLVEIATKKALLVYFESYFEKVEFGFNCHFKET